jgi:hypothetical protein
MENIKFYLKMIKVFRKNIGILKLLKKNLLEKDTGEKITFGSAPFLS